MSDEKPYLIHVSDLCKAYKQKDQLIFALKHLSLSVEKGDIYGIIGLSGAGKSTLIRSLSGLVKPTSGKIFFDKQEIGLMDEAELRDIRLKMGMIFQNFNLLTSRTVAGNIAYPLEVAGVPLELQEKKIDELLRFVGLTRKKETYISHLSGGEKQRVGIARALANDPEILFCDEATSALDPKTTQEILDLLTMVNQDMGLTIVLITHDMEVIKKICNKVAVIEGGMIVESGPVSKIFADPQHPTTKQFLQKGSHQVPLEFFKPASPNRKLLRLRFKGKSTAEPLISKIVKSYHVDANIVMGWIDRLQTSVIGTLVIELTGSPEGIRGATDYLTEQSVHWEELTDE